jgi:hypothetical protein
MCSAHFLIVYYKCRYLKAVLYIVDLVCVKNVINLFCICRIYGTNKCEWINETAEEMVEILTHAKIMNITANITCTSCKSEVTHSLIYKASVSCL